MNHPIYPAHRQHRPQLKTPAMPPEILRLADDMFLRACRVASQMIAKYPDALARIRTLDSQVADEVFRKHRLEIAGRREIYEALPVDWLSELAESSEVAAALPETIGELRGFLALREEQLLTEVHANGS